MACALDQLADRWPGLDMAKLRILREIDNRPGLALCDIAEALSVTHQHVQFHVATLATGKLGRPRAALGLVAIDADPLDKRRRQLRLTSKGRRVVRMARPLLGPSRRTETQLEIIDR